MTLPDLKKSEISWLAFYNVLDNGADSIDPIHLAENNLATYEEFSNGVQGTYSVGYAMTTSRTARVRIKEDGWVIVWFDRQQDDNVLDVADGTEIRGPHDLVNDWSKAYVDSTPPAAKKHKLERVVNDIVADLQNPGTLAYAPSDVNLYNYRHEDATNVSIGVIDNTGMDVSITSSTDLKLAWAAGNAYYEREAVWATGSHDVVLARGDAKWDWFIGAQDLIEYGNISTGTTFHATATAYGSSNQENGLSLVTAWA